MNKEKVLLYNVGVSEITLISSRKYEEKKVFRPENLFKITEEIYEKLKKEKETYWDVTKSKIKFKYGLSIGKNKEFLYEIKFNLLDEYLKKINKKSKIILIATHQRKVNPKDTIYVAEILKIYLEKLGYKNINITKIVFSPVDVQKLVKFYNQILKENKNKKVIANVTSGTPQQTVSLSLLSLKHKNLVLLYKSWEQRKMQKWDLKKYLSQL